MSDYYPDKWQIVKIDHAGTSHYRVFACWYGGYAGSDSWKLNSGIVKATLKDNCYHFEGSSGSTYVCHKDTYGANFYGGGVLASLIKEGKEVGTIIEPLAESVNPLELNYEDTATLLKP